MKGDNRQDYYSELQKITHQARTLGKAWLTNKEEFRRIITEAVDNGFAEEIEITDVTTIENQGN